MKLSLKKGFTLIELLVVIAIVIALGVAVFAALNPGQRLKDARDARRTSDLDTILTAIHQYIIDSKGDASGLGLTTADQQLGTGATGCAIATGGCTVVATACLNIAGTGGTLLSKYLKSMPIDPLGGTTYTAAKTGYAVSQDANGLITVKACGTGSGTTEGATNMSASR